MLLTKYYSSGQIEKNEMGGACSTMGGEERCIQGFGEQTGNGDPGVDGRIIRIKMDRQEVGCQGMDWIEQVQDRGRWRALVNAVMNLGVP